MLDSALSLYSNVARIPKAEGDDIHKLNEFIKRPDLGGGCCFTGDDLGPQSSLYSEEHNVDLIIPVKLKGEDDSFTNFLAGPVLSMYFKIFHHLKVSD